jgi:hypothetical protein
MSVHKDQHWREKRFSQDWGLARRSLWKLYYILEILHVVSDDYSASDGPVSLYDGDEFTDRYSKEIYE